MIAEPVQELSFCVSPSGKVLRHLAFIPHLLSCCLQSLAVSHSWLLTRAIRVIRVLRVQYDIWFSDTCDLVSVRVL